MSRNFIADDLILAARDILALTFPTKDALEKYLNDHPKADKSKHKVEEAQQEGGKKEVPSQKPVVKKEEPKKEKEEGGSDDMEDHVATSLRDQLLNSGKVVTEEEMLKKVKTPDGKEVDKDAFKKIWDGMVDEEYLVKTEGGYKWNDEGLFTDKSEEPKEKKDEPKAEPKKDEGSKTKFDSGEASKTKDDITGKLKDLVQQHYSSGQGGAVTALLQDIIMNSVGSDELEQLSKNLGAWVDKHLGKKEPKKEEQKPEVKDVPKFEPERAEPKKEDFGAQETYVVAVRKHFSDATGLNVKDVLPKTGEMSDWAHGKKGTESAIHFIDSVWHGFCKSGTEVVAQGAKDLVKKGGNSFEDVMTQLELGKSRTQTVMALAEGGQTVLGTKIEGVYQKNLIDTKKNQLKEWDEVINSFKKGAKAPVKKDKNVVNGTLPKNNNEEE